MKTIFFAALVAILSFGGCRSVNTVEPEQSRTTPTPLLSKVQVTDSQLANRIEIVDVNQAVASGDLLKVQVQVKSISSHYRSFNYKFIWIEQDGMAVQSPAPVWRSTQLPAGGVAFVTGIAPNPRVVDFKLELISSGDARDGLF